MALRDLIAQKSALTEEAIEELVREFVRYDPEEMEIAFTPEFGGLGNRAKVLVYLVAIQGWEYVVDAPMSADTKPADLEEKLGIPGGTLRPLLKDLKDRHLVVSKGSGYTVRPSHLAAIKRELEARSSSTPVPGRRGRGARKAKAKPSERTQESKAAPISAPSASPAKRRKVAASGGDLKRTFDQWVSQGFFDQPKTLRDVQNRFHEEAILIPQSSIPKYLLAGVRDGRLSRKKQQVGSKTVWVYQAKVRG